MIMFVLVVRVHQSGEGDGTWKWYPLGWLADHDAFVCGGFHPSPALCIGHLSRRSVGRDGM